MYYKGVGSRFVALLIDTILMLIVGFIIAIFAGATTFRGGLGFELQGTPAFILFAIWALYYIILEGTAGGTLGKKALGIRIVKEDGSPCGIQASIVRNLLRIIDGLFFYLVGAILIWQSSNKQRLGDRIAKTLVVEA